MSIITDAAASIVGIGVIVLVMILLANMNDGIGSHLFKAAHPWVHRGLAVLMYGASSLIAVTGLGGVWQGIVHWAMGFIPGADAAIPAEIITIASFFLILGLVGGVAFDPGEAVVMFAALVPFALILTSHGFIHDFWNVTSGPTMNAATAFNNWVGG